jgi:hypothetical protein
VSLSDNDQKAIGALKYQIWRKSLFCNKMNDYKTVPPICKAFISTEWTFLIQLTIGEFNAYNCTMTHIEETVLCEWQVTSNGTQICK